ncbi:MAG: mechanosensitive ion channel family protein [Gammaproteobacteria bacterium]
MEDLTAILDAFPALLPLLSVCAVTAVSLWAVQRGVVLRFLGLQDNLLPQQLIIVILLAIGVVVAILTLPISPETKTQLLSLFGLLLTAIIAFSSTTLVTNAMAGLMLRAIGGFHAGDFIRAGDHFGRVTEQGLFHTEIQTGNRDLTAIPNVFLVTNPVTVVRHSGTIVETTLSLGYDVGHERAEELLIKAAHRAGLEEAFVHLLDLGNFAVTYRVAGFLGETRHLVSAGSQLRRAVLDTLHGAGIEIASPNLMAQRPLAPDSRLVPRERGKTRERRQEAQAEDIVFDKAEEAGRLGALRHELGEITEAIAALEKSAAEAEEAERARFVAEIEGKRRRMAEVEAELASAEEA